MLGYKLLQGLFEQEAAQKKPVVSARKWTEDPPSERERFFVKANSVLSVSLFDYEDWEDWETPWSFEDWLVNICFLAVVGFFACALYYNSFIRPTQPKPVVVKEKREPHVEYHYNLTPAQFDELQYRQQIEAIDRQVTERIKNNHLSEPVK